MNYFKLFDIIFNSYGLKKAMTQSIGEKNF